MKTRIDSQTVLDEDTSRALRLLHDIPRPDEGMQNRIVQQLRRQHEQATPMPAWRFSRAIIFLPVMAALALAIVAWFHHGRPAPLQNQAAYQVPQLGRHSTVAPGAAPPPVIGRASHAALRTHRWSVSPVVHTQPAETQRAATAVAQVAPPLPLTQGERLLLALARSPSVLPALDSIARSETVNNHGLGRNAILELNHGPLPKTPSAPIGDFE